MSITTVSTPIPVGNESRGLFSDWFNATNIAKEDFQRNLQLAKYEQDLNLESMTFQNEFNASQARIQRAWEEEMANSQYTRAVADLKNAGLNPILAYTNMQNNTPTGASSSSGSGAGTRTKGTYGKSPNTSAVVGSLINLASTAVSLAVGLYGNAAVKGMHFGFGK